MFSNLSENKIPPNFLNSLLTNSALYSMFKDDFETNAEYFQDRSKEEYITAMRNFIEEKLFSGNIYSISENDDIENAFKTNKVTEYITRFYDDFLLSEVKNGYENLFKVSFFKGLNHALNYDKYAKENEEFLKLYDYVFKESIDFEKSSNEILLPIKNKLNNDETLLLSEFDTLCNYTQNNIRGYIDMDIVTGMIKNHAYKRNPIFNRCVVEELTKSLASDYFAKYDIDARLEFGHYLNVLKDKAMHSLNPNIIYIDYFLIDSFIAGNFTELFNTLFYEMSIIKQSTLLAKNEINYETFKVIMNLVNEKVDLDKIFVDEEYKPYNYFSDLKASAFIKTLRFYELLGVDLFDNYNYNKTKNLSLNPPEEYIIPKKEISLEIMFQNRFSKLGCEKIKALIDKYPVISIFYDESGNKKRTIDILNKALDEKFKPVIETYIHSSIVKPDDMIDDVNDLLGVKSKNEEINSLIERILKYIYVDAFYYSLNSYIKLKIGKSSFNAEEYLDDLIIKINCIKDTPLSHRFIDEALFVIEDAKQNL